MEDDNRQDFSFVDYQDSPGGGGDRSRESSSGRDFSRQEMTEERRAKLREIEVGHRETWNELFYLLKQRHPFREWQGFLIMVIVFG